MGADGAIRCWNDTQPGVDVAALYFRDLQSSVTQITVSDIEIKLCED